jgi:hypothetical protein
VNWASEEVANVAAEALEDVEAEFDDCQDKEDCAVFDVVDVARSPEDASVVGCDYLSLLGVA